MDRFTGASVVVTGGASGIGEATCRGIVREGGRVLIADLQEELGQALAEELGEAAAFVATDVTREEDIEAAIAAAVAQFGGLTGMVNNAGVIGVTGSIKDTSAEAFDHTMAILSRAVFFGIKHAARAMEGQGSGSIVSLASTAGVIGGLGYHVYTMAKHGVVGLTKSAACELAPQGIRVNAVAPGNTVTPMTAALADNDTDLISRQLAEASPMGVACQPEDIANAILYALSDDSRCMTGHTMLVDMGETCGGGFGRSWLYSEDSEVLLHAGQRQKF
jgi:NAD(P)-dependent dehydrogenase (short-subunit alcohol dehydrogenase family)